MNCTTPVGGGRRFRKGVHRLAQALNRPVIPGATNLGCFWPEQEPVLYPGTAVIEFLPPVSADTDSRRFMAALQARVEMRTRELEAEAISARSST